MLSWQVGAVKITRIVEMEMPIGYSEKHPFLPDATPQALRKMPWLYPNFVNEEDQLLLSIHALLVEAPGMKLVVDTCIGNDKPRKFLRGEALATPFLEHLARAGWSRDGVDAVVCTHLHVDHASAGTPRSRTAAGSTDSSQRPPLTLIGRRELEHWQGEPDEEQQTILGDSVQPEMPADAGDSRRGFSGAGSPHLPGDQPLAQSLARTPGSTSA